MPVQMSRVATTKSATGTKANRARISTIWFDSSVPPVEAEKLTTLIHNGKPSMRVQPYFSRELSIVVTNRKDWKKFNQKNHELSPIDAISPAVVLLSENGTMNAGSPISLGGGGTVGTNGGAAPSALRIGTSRSKAMLTKIADKQHVVSNDQNDVLAQAQKFRIRVLSLKRFQELLQTATRSSAGGVTGTLPSRKKRFQSSNCIGPKHRLYVPLGDHFLKIEDACGIHRPIVKAYSQNGNPGSAMPVMNFDTNMPPGHCRFAPPPRHRHSTPSSQKRKGKRPMRARDLVGHCTVCRTTYAHGIEEHAKSLGHRHFTTDPKTYVHLDRMVIQMGLTLDSFKISRPNLGKTPGPPPATLSDSVADTTVEASSAVHTVRGTTATASSVHCSVSVKQGSTLKKHRQEGSVDDSRHVDKGNRKALNTIINNATNALPFTTDDLPKQKHRDVSEKDGHTHPLRKRTFKKTSVVAPAVAKDVGNFHQLRDRDVATTLQSDDDMLLAETDFTAVKVSIQTNKQRRTRQTRPDVPSVAATSSAKRILANIMAEEVASTTVLPSTAQTATPSEGLNIGDGCGNRGSMHHHQDSQHTVIHAGENSTDDGLVPFLDHEQSGVSGLDDYDSDGDDDDDDDEEEILGTTSTGVWMGKSESDGTGLMSGVGDGIMGDDGDDDGVIQDVMTAPTSAVANVASVAAGGGNTVMTEDADGDGSGGGVEDDVDERSTTIIHTHIKQQKRPPVTARKQDTAAAKQRILERRAQSPPPAPIFDDEEAEAKEVQDTPYPGTRSRGKGSVTPTPIRRSSGRHSRRRVQGSTTGTAIATCHRQSEKQVFHSYVPRTTNGTTTQPTKTAGFQLLQSYHYYSGALIYAFCPDDHNVALPGYLFPAMIHTPPYVGADGGVGVDVLFDDNDPPDPVRIPIQWVTVVDEVTPPFVAALSSPLKKICRKNRTITWTPDEAIYLPLLSWLGLGDESGKKGSKGSRGGGNGTVAAATTMAVKADTAGVGCLPKTNTPTTKVTKVPTKATKVSTKTSKVLTKATKVSTKTTKVLDIATRHAAEEPPASPTTTEYDAESILEQILRKQRDDKVPLSHLLEKNGNATRAPQCCGKQLQTAKEENGDVDPVANDVEPRETPRHSRRRQRNKRKRRDMDDDDDVIVGSLPSTEHVVAPIAKVVDPDDGIGDSNGIDGKLTTVTSTSTMPSVPPTNHMTYSPRVVAIVHEDNSQDEDCSPDDLPHSLQLRQTTTGSGEGHDGVVARTPPSYRTTTMAEGHALLLTTPPLITPPIGTIRTLREGPGSSSGSLPAFPGSRSMTTVKKSVSRVFSTNGTIPNPQVSSTCMPGAAGTTRSTGHVQSNTTASSSGGICGKCTGPQIEKPACTAATRTNSADAGDTKVLNVRLMRRQLSMDTHSEPRQTQRKRTRAVQRNCSEETPSIGSGMNHKHKASQLDHIADYEDDSQVTVGMKRKKKKSRNIIPPSTVETTSSDKTKCTKMPWEFAIMSPLPIRDDSWVTMPPLSDAERVPTQKKGTYRHRNKPVMFTHGWNDATPFSHEHDSSDDGEGGDGTSERRRADPLFRPLGTKSPSAKHSKPPTGMRSKRFKSSNREVATAMFSPSTASVSPYFDTKASATTTTKTISPYFDSVPYKTRTNNNRAHHHHNTHRELKGTTGSRHHRDSNAAAPPPVPALVPQQQQQHPKQKSRRTKKCAGTKQGDLDPSRAQHHPSVITGTTSCGPSSGSRKHSGQPQKTTSFIKTGFIKVPVKCVTKKGAAKRNDPFLFND